MDTQQHTAHNTIQYRVVTVSCLPGSSLRPDLSQGALPRDREGLPVVRHHLKLLIILGEGSVELLDERNSSFRVVIHHSEAPDDLRGPLEPLVHLPRVRWQIEEGLIQE